MKRSIWKRVTNRQLQNLLVGVAFTLMVMSTIEPLARLLLLIVAILSPLAFGHIMAILFDFMDDSIQYRVEFSKKTHFIMGSALSLMMAFSLATLSSLTPLFPYSPITNSFFLVIPPRTVFFIWGLVSTGIGYWLAWRQFIPNKRQ